MASLWTPDGERRVAPATPKHAEQPERAEEAQSGAPGDQDFQGLDPEEAKATAADLAELRRQLAEAPVEGVIANHCYGMFELAALHLSQNPPSFEEARLAIDAMAALVEGLEGRLGEYEDQLNEGLAQLRMAFVQVQAAQSAANQ
jgi:hypothetical protein